MKSYSPKEIIKILKQNGWKLDRIRGSHYILKKEETNQQTIVPVSKNSIPIGTVKAIEKQSGMKFK